MLTEFFFNNDINNSECKKCAYKYLCGGPCKAVSYNLTGSLLEGRGEYCKHAKKECQEYLRSIQFGGESWNSFMIKNCFIDTTKRSWKTYVFCSW